MCALGVVRARVIFLSAISLPADESVRVFFGVVRMWASLFVGLRNKRIYTQPFGESRSTGCIERFIEARREKMRAS